MADRLVIDTFNVLHVTGVLPPDLAGPDAVKLAGLIRRSRWAGADVRLVCDGGAGNLVLPAGLAAQSQIRLVFAGHGPDAADIMIERIVAQDSAPRTLLVVSSDRRILTAARKRRCAVLTSEQFLGRLVEDVSIERRNLEGRNPGERGEAADLGSPAMWLHEFGFESGERLEESASAEEQEVDPLDAELGELGIGQDDLDMGRWVDGVERDDGEDDSG